MQNKKKTKVAAWLAIKFFFYVFNDSLTDIKQVWRSIKKDIEFLKSLGLTLYLSDEVIDIEGIIIRNIGA